MSKYRILKRKRSTCERYLVQEYWRPFWPFPYKWISLTAEVPYLVAEAEFNRLVANQPKVIETIIKEY